MDMGTQKLLAGILEGQGTLEDGKVSAAFLS